MTKEVKGKDRRLKRDKKKPTWNLLDDAVEDAVDIHHNKRAFIYLRVT